MMHGKRESGQNEWRDVEYQGAMAKAPAVPDRTLKTPLGAGEVSLLRSWPRKC